MWILNYRWIISAQSRAVSCLHNPSPLYCSASWTCRRGLITHSFLHRHRRTWNKGTTALHHLPSSTRREQSAQPGTNIQTPTHVLGTVALWKHRHRSRFKESHFQLKGLRSFAGASGPWEMMFYGSPAGEWQLGKLMFRHHMLGSKVTCVTVASATDVAPPTGDRKWPCLLLRRPAPCMFLTFSSNRVRKTTRPGWSFVEKPRFHRGRGTSEHQRLTVNVKVALTHKKGCAISIRLYKF